ncbi:glycosyl transferase [Limnochorda pilosa]|uniref:Glycosyl transferase n=2 Tax=Limnochorda pilosa TaxID=1555112 RepID=A0A0K2SMP3_LIMPI|nr:glycosyl transferase [Limnochorda pilosa]
MNSANGKPVADVSVVIPFYNGHQFMQRALDSVTRQTVLPRRVVVVDDGSQIPLQLVTSYQADGVEVVVIRHEQNRGIPAARNTGIRAAETEWIGFLDQDDEWARDKLERQMEYVRTRGRSGVAIFGSMLVAERGRVTPRPAVSRWLATNPSGMELAERLLRQGNFVPWGTMLVHRAVFESVGLLDESLRGGSDDYDFVLRAAVASQLVWGQTGQSAMLTRHEHEANYSRVDRFFADTTRISSKWLLSSDPKLRAAARQALGRQWFSLARYFHRTGEFQEAVQGYGRSLVLGSAVIKSKAVAGAVLAVAHVRR